MAAVGNYEVVDLSFGPYSDIHTTHHETVAAPDGKVILGGGVKDLENANHHYTGIYPRTDGTTLNVEINLQSSTATYGAYIVCAELGGEMACAIVGVG